MNPNLEYKAYISKQLHDRSKGAKIEELENLDITRIYVTKKVSEYYSKKHKVDGIKGIHDTLRELIAEGHIFREEDGAIILFGEGYRVVLSPEATAVLSYKCIHRERSLPAKRSGVKSKFHKSSAEPKLLTKRLDDQTIDNIIFPKIILSEFLDNLDLDYHDLLETLQDCIADAMDNLEEYLITDSVEYIKKINEYRSNPADMPLTSSYTLLKNGNHLISMDGFSITLRNDGLRVITLFIE